MLRMSLVVATPPGPLWSRYLMIPGVRWGVRGEAAARLRLPPQLHSGKYVYGRGAPRGPRWPRRLGPHSVGASSRVLATAIRRQGIRTHRAKGPGSPKRKPAEASAGHRARLRSLAYYEWCYVVTPRIWGGLRSSPPNHARTQVRRHAS